MRHEGESRPEVYNAYEESLVQLTDDCMKETYLAFMLIYMGDFTDENLERFGIEEVHDPSPHLQQPRPLRHPLNSTAPSVRRSRQRCSGSSRCKR